MIPKKAHLTRSDAVVDARTLLANSMSPDMGGGPVRIRHDEASSGCAGRKLRTAARGRSCQSCALNARTGARARGGPLKSSQSSCPTHPRGGGGGGVSALSVSSCTRLVMNLYSPCEQHIMNQT